MSLAAIYVRVSTAEQAEKGYSLDTQIEACQRAAKADGATSIDKYVDDGYSGEFLDRPDLDRLRNNLKTTKYDMVVIYDPDRLARNLAHQLIVTEEIEKSGASLKFVSVTFEKSPEGKLFYSIRGAISDYEKEKIKERTMRGMRGKARKGKLTRNDKAIGFDFNEADQMYVINEAEARIIRKIYDLCANCRLGTRTIARELNLLGYRTKNGKRFYMAAILRILTNPMYKGTKIAFKYYDKQVGQHKTKRIIRSTKDWVEIAVPAIVDKQTWDKAQQVLASNRMLSKRNAKYPYLLSGFLKCGFCGMAMQGMNYTAHGYEYRYYICGSKTTGHKCENRYIPLDNLDREVWETLRKKIQERNHLPKIVPAPSDAGNREQINASLKDLKARQSAIVKWVCEGTIDTNTAEKDLQNIKKEIELATSKLKNLVISKPPAIINSGVLQSETYEQKRHVLKEWNAKIYVKRDANGQIHWGVGRL